MKIFHGLESVTPRSFLSPVLTIGVFDGVHRGHQAIIAELRAWAKGVGGESIVITFDRIPERVLTGQEPFQITSVQHRLLLFERYGVDAAIVLEFDEKLAGTTAEDFLAMLAGSISPLGILMGFDSTYGRKRKGTAAFTRKHGEKHGIKVREVEPVVMEGGPVSSTRIREAVMSGELETAAMMLGRPVSIFGIVIEGDGRGRTLGYPTANIDPEHHVRLPNGVYGGETEFGGKTHPTLVNIGRRPTFETNGRELIEAHLLDFKGNLYGQELLLRFFRRIRGEKAFSSAAELVKQIDRDKGEFEKAYPLLRSVIP
ncbi:MAG: riboflavin biosynthesis protein RibF [Planctomycetota bacterium]|jgi:riboflavin kinase/FMN adenylyltransferase